MEVYLQSLGMDFRQSIKNGYEVPKTTLMDAFDRRQHKNNAKAINSILCVLAYFEFTKVILCTSSKTMWDKLNNIYEGDDKFNKDKLQTFSRRFESMNMKEE